MICRRCGKKVEKGWRFCPNCGSVTERPSKSLFDEIFSRFRREFRDMDRTFNRFDKEFEVLDLSPFLRKPRTPRGRGFTIKITRRNNQQPKVDVKTFGNVDRDAVRKEIREEMHSLGMKQRSKDPLPEPARDEDLPVKPTREEKPAKFMEEPKTNVKSLGTKLVVEMELDDVKSQDDIDVNELESSVEVRARAGDKAYFKIIKKPGQFSVKSKRFEKGKLFLEFS
jgi:hypothetical protein